MPGHLPDSYGRLASYAHRFAAGTAVYEQGSTLDRCFVVLRGRLDFEVVSESGDPEVVAHVPPGGVAGHVAAFTGRPTSAAARAATDSVILVIPVDRVLEVFREAPELALLLVRSFADPERARQTLDAVEDADDAPAPEPAAPAAEAEVVRLPGEFDEALFFLDTTTCPVDGTRFEFLRVRTRAVRPASRDTDFHVRYSTVDPTRYSVVVCPGCGYAAYLDDFGSLDEEARARLWDDRGQRTAALQRSLDGVRDLADATAALDLAIHCYEQRQAGHARLAVLYHRRAWIDREQGAASEAGWLRRARDTYRRAYEQDSRITDDSALRAAYLVGDLSLRLGEVREGAPWLETVIRRGDSRAHSGLVRMARDRLYDARQQLRADRQAG